MNLSESYKKRLTELAGTQNENLSISKPNTPEYRFRQYVDSILEDLDTALKSNDLAQIKIQLGGLYNMIINDSHYVFNPERFPSQNNAEDIDFEVK